MAFRRKWPKNTDLRSMMGPQQAPGGFGGRGGSYIEMKNPSAQG